MTQALAVAYEVCMKFQNPATAATGSHPLVVTKQLLPNCRGVAIGRNAKIKEKLRPLSCK
jgi:hypothetical protein